MSDVPMIELRDGALIPQLGFGVFQIPPDETADAVETALQIGYRHIDTAEMYQNERGVGQGIRAAGLDRSAVYITSKLNNGFHRPDDARRAFDDTLTALIRTMSICSLIHWPLPTPYDGDYVSTWQTLEQIQERGARAQHRRVELPGPTHLQRLAQQTDTTPAVNQIEVHPYFTNDTVRVYGADHGIATEWSPIAQGNVLGDPVVRRIAEATGKTPAQVVLRWHIQRGDIVFPKSVTPQRVRENFALFDFELHGFRHRRVDGAG